LSKVSSNFYRDDVRLALDYPEDDRFFKELINIPKKRWKSKY